MEILKWTPLNYIQITGQITVHVKNNTGLIILTTKGLVHYFLLFQSHNLVKTKV